MKKKLLYVLGAVSVDKSKTLKYHTVLKKKLVLSFICNRCGSIDEKYSKKKNQLIYYRLLVLLVIGMGKSFIYFCFSVIFF